MHAEIPIVRATAGCEEDALCVAVSVRELEIEVFLP